MQAVLFAITAFLALGGGVGVVASRRPVHSALGLLLVLLCLAVDYLLLDAQFVAVLQVIIYAGAIVVLFVFIIMLLHARSGESPAAGVVLPPALGIALSAIFAIIVVAAVAGAGRVAAARPGPGYGTVQQVGQALFTTYGLPFEAASLVLVVGMIGAVALGKRVRPALGPAPRAPEAEAAAGVPSPAGAGTEVSDPAVAGRGEGSA